jgi:serine/threonine protein kinase
MSSRRARLATADAQALIPGLSDEAAEKLLASALATMAVDARLAFAGVCSAWRALARDPALWASVSVSPYAGLSVPPTAALVRAACACAPPGALRELDVSGCAQLMGSPGAHAELLSLLRASAGLELRVLRACRGTPGRGDFLTLGGCDELRAAAPRLTELHVDVDVSTAEDEDALLRALLSDAATRCERFASLRLRFAACRADGGLHAALAGVPELHLRDADLASEDGRVDALALAAGSQRLHFLSCQLPASASASVRLLLQLLRQPGLQALTLAGRTGATLFGAPNEAQRAQRVLHDAPPHAVAAALTSLSLCGVGLFASAPCAAALLRILAREARLQRLDLSNNSRVEERRREEVGAALGVLLADAPALTWLDVSECGLGDAGLRPLATALAPNRLLRELRLQHNSMTSAFLADVLLPAVRANRSLRALRVEAQAEAARRAEEIVWRRSLAELDAQGPGCRPAGAAAAAAAASEHGYPSYGTLRGLSDYAPQQRLLGKGAFGDVCVAADAVSGELIALKLLRRHGHASRGLDVALVREAAILGALNHSHVVAFRGVVLCPRGGVRLALELAAGGTLEDALWAHAAGPRRGTPLPECNMFAAQLAAALAFCARRGVLHRDVAPKNVLLRGAEARAPHLLLCDFGLARRAPRFPHPRLSNDMPWTPNVVTITYRAPELLLGATRYGPPLDCWSLGCIVAEMALGTGAPLFCAATNDAAAHMARVVEVCGTPLSHALQALPGFGEFAQHPPQPCRLEELLRGRPLAALAVQLLQLDPAARLSAEAALNATQVAVVSRRNDDSGTRSLRTPYLSAAQLEALPARLDGATEAADARHRHELVGFIYDLAADLGLPAHVHDDPRVPAALPSAAATYAQRYFAQRSHVCEAERGSFCFVGAAALLLACKALGGNTQITCRAVAWHAFARRHHGAAPDDEACARYCRRIVAFEWLLAVALGFSFNVHTPEEEIAACALHNSHTELYLQAHRLCRAMASTSLKLRFDAATLAACALALAARMLANGPQQRAMGMPLPPPTPTLKDAARLLDMRTPATDDLIAVDTALVAYWSRFLGESALDALARITQTSLDAARTELAERLGELSPHAGVLPAANSPAWNTPQNY